MLTIIKKFKRLLSKEEQKKVIWLLVITIVGAFFEIIGVSMVVPLIMTIMQPDIMKSNSFIAQLCSSFCIHSHIGFIVLCITVMILVFIAKSLFLIFQNYYSAKFVFNSRFRMQQKMLHAFLKKPYEYYLNAQSGEIMRIVYGDVQSSYSILNTLLSLASESLLSCAIIIVVVHVNPLMSLLTMAMVTLLVLITTKVIRPILQKDGDIFRQHLSKTYKWLLQSIQGIKEIKICRREIFFERNFEQSGQLLINSEKKYSVLNGIPRIIIEVGCICSALLAMLIVIASGNDAKSLVPALAAFTMAAVKLMPAAVRIINAVGVISYHGHSLDRLIEHVSSLDDKTNIAENTTIPITLHNKVELKNITYRYKAESEPILSDTSMMISAGSTVGIVGTSGAGKTTTADILIGLLQPQAGKILSDGIDVKENYAGWLDLIGYIPQNIFMLDDTIRENVVFGNNSFDDAKVWKALDEAHLADFVKRQPLGLDTQIGERGIRLSGGQRQRIGIARALYNNPELLVFDEATSSLDTETESAILESVNALHGHKTIIIIAHRPQTIENCDVVYRVQNGKIIKER